MSFRLVPALFALAVPAIAHADNTVVLQTLLDQGYEVRAALNQGSGYEVVVQKEASVYVCNVLTTAFAPAKGAPKSTCAKLSAK